MHKEMCDMSIIHMKKITNDQRADGEHCPFCEWGVVFLRRGPPADSPEDKGPKEAGGKQIHPTRRADPQLFFYVLRISTLLFNCFLRITENT